MYQEILTKILGIFDIPSGPMIGLWSIIILIGCAYSIFVTKTVTAPVATIFCAVLTNYCAHKISKVMKGNEQDSKGDNNDDSTSPKS